ncbi:cytosol aminopeptidase [Klebsiella aerogenes]|nr:cytosol aminopeptidase [Klebsiella aerogenes]
MIPVQWKPSASLTELHVKGRNNYWKVRQAVETAKETLYSFDQLKTNKSEPRRPLRKWSLTCRPVAS